MSPASLTRNITSHSMKSQAFHSLLRWKMIILPIPITSYHFSLKCWENVHFELWVKGFQPMNFDYSAYWYFLRCTWGTGYLSNTTRNFHNVRSFRPYPAFFFLFFFSSCVLYTFRSIFRSYTIPLIPEAVASWAEESIYIQFTLDEPKVRGKNLEKKLEITNSACGIFHCTWTAPICARAFHNWKWHLIFLRYAYPPHPRRIFVTHC